MRIVSAITLAIFISSAAAGQIINPDYDSTLARKLGSDEYGMKMYVFVVLKTGPNIVKNKVLRDSLFIGHMKNIRKLADMKKLVVAGPMEDNQRYYRGIFILDVRTFEEATKLLETDPTIRGKIFDTEMYMWYGSAALPEYLEASDKIWKVSP
jgi:uncharacterized protein